MPKISDISDVKTPGFDIPGLPWLEKAIGPQLCKGWSYLVAGEPGIGKSTMSLQILGALSCKNIKTLYLTSEQGLGVVDEEEREKGEEVEKFEPAGCTCPAGADELAS